MNRSFSSSSSSSAVTALFAALALTACGSSVSSGGGSGGGGEGGAGSSVAVTTTTATGGIECEGDCCEPNCSTSVSSGGGGIQGSGGASPTDGPTMTADAIAMLYSELPSFDGGGEGTSVASTGSGPSIDPNTLEIFVGGQPIACGAPYGLDCGNQWTVSFSLPPAYQVPGVYTMQEVNGFASETGPGGGEECWFGGGSFWDGTVEIFSIDEQQIVGRFTGTSGLFEFNADGDFIAARCAF